MEVGDSGDELGALLPVNLGPELEAQALLQLVAFGSQPLDLFPGKREVGS